MSKDLVPTSGTEQLRSLGPADQAAAVTQMLNAARQALTQALAATDPEHVALVKAYAATVAESTKQLKLSKSIRLDAEEMVRRAERGLSQTVRKGQEEGTVEKRAESATKASLKVRKNAVPEQYDAPKPSPRSFYPSSTEWTESNKLADATEENFEEALTEARAEGNLSRANVARKTTQKESRPVTRAERIRTLADAGHSSRQIAAIVGIGERSLNDIIVAEGIIVSADVAVKRTRRIDSNRIVGNSVSALEGVLAGLSAADITELDPAMRDGWAASLREASKALLALAKRIEKLP